MSRALGLLCTVLAVVVVAGAAEAQTLGTFSWQLQPYCNVVTFTVTHAAGVFQLDGFEDRCNPSRRAAATGVAFLRPDGTIGMGISILTTPGGQPLHVDATLNPSTFSGTWRDSTYHAGTLAFGAPASGSPRFDSDGLLLSTSADGPGLLIGVYANGPREAPTPPAAGDELALFGGAGYRAGPFPFAPAFMTIAATENWSSSATGSKIAFFTSPNGSSSSQARLTIADDGEVGIGTTTPADRLDVNGDIRVGTGGVNGCVKRKDGTMLVGVCSSDLRFKRDVTPFGPALDAVARLRPVHYFWRRDEFPAKTFGATQSYGLVAQDVAEVLPELVSRDGEGYLAVDYAKLPLLAIQAIRELKDENQQLKARDADMERRLSELEARLRQR